MSDLYETLGVGRGASAEEIKRGYRKKAMRSHPDRGGTKEAFHAVQKAYEVLSDPARKGNYDRTGDDQPRVDSIDGRAVSELGNLIVQAIERSGDPERADLLGEIKSSINVALAQAHESISGMKKRIDKFERCAKRAKRKKAGANLIEQMMIGQANILRNAILLAEDRIAVGEKMLEVLAEYSYEYERKQAYGYEPTNYFGSPMDFFRR